MKNIEKVRNLLMRGLELNDWILERPCRIDNGLPEWNNILDELSEYDNITVRLVDSEEFEYLIKEFRSGVNKISEYMSKRVIITRIKYSIMEERVNNA